MYRLMIPALAVMFLLPACTQSRGAMITEKFIDDFERTALGSDWYNTGGGYRIENGVLKIQDAKNRPLWLKKRLPRDVKVELDAWSDSPEGDIKIELFGDGASYAKTAAYTATSYVLIFGGWKNSKSIIARMDEHASDRQVRTDVRVVPGRKYHFSVTRKGNLLSWSIDGSPFLRMDDQMPLEGKGHEYFGFNNWSAPLSFDNLVIEAL